MNKLAEAFSLAATRRDNPDWVWKLMAFAREAMSPFKTGNIRISIHEEGFRGLDRTFRIEFETLPKYPFVHMIDDTLVLDSHDIDSFMLEALSKPLFEHLRYRPSLPVDDHIVLGED